MADGESVPEILMIRSLYKHGSDGECVQTQSIQRPVMDLEMSKYADIQTFVRHVKSTMKIGEPGHPKFLVVVFDIGIQHKVEQWVCADLRASDEGRPTEIVDWLIPIFDDGHALWYLEQVMARKYNYRLESRSSADVAPTLAF